LVPLPPERTRFDVTLSTHCSHTWFETYCHAEHFDRKEATVRREILERICQPTAYVTLSEGDLPIATGLGVAHGGWVGIFCMATIAEYQRRGAVSALLAALAR
jgi:hypothetical protein